MPMCPGVAGRSVNRPGIAIDRIRFNAAVFPPLAKSRCSPNSIVEIVAG